MVYFSDYFKVSEDAIEKYGAFNISIISDLPLFVDPFLLFGSEVPELQALHKGIIKYLTFLKEKSEQGITDIGEIKAWYIFSEVKQNWFGYSIVGNSGRGLGPKFAKVMSTNMHLVYADLGNEKISKSSHLEKAALFQIGVGKDNISDFTTNLIKSYLLSYTEKFAKDHINTAYCQIFNVEKAYFDYTLQKWMPKLFSLPVCKGDFVLLTPKSILTKDENWINSNDLHGKLDLICNAIPNDQLRSEINNYFRSRLPLAQKKEPTQKEKTQATIDTIQKFPKLIDYYIKLKEESKESAKSVSQIKVKEIESLFVNGVNELIKTLSAHSEFYQIPTETSYLESMKRVNFMKHVIEKNDGYRLFYVKDQPVKREQDLQIIFNLTWFASPFDVNREVNNGRGPVDYKVSKGAQDKTLIEFKLASNTQLKKNLMNQVKVYEEANQTTNSIKVILYFSMAELQSIKLILKELKQDNDTSIILIDACRDNKKSASTI